VGEYIPTTSTINSAPRFDHNPTTRESLGLLVEEARTNLVLQSEDFSTTWTNNGSSENVNAIIAPNGTLTADALVDTAVSEIHAFSQSIAGLAGSTAYTFSCFMKKGSKDFGALVFVPNSSWAGGAGASVFFNLNTGVVGTTTNATASIQAYPSGWYRCIATVTTVASPGTVTARIGSSLTGGSQTYTGAGDEAIYVWGAQLEAASFPTSYIPTTTATVTRAADVVSITGSNFSSWYRQDAVSVFSQSTKSNAATGAPFSINDGTSNNRISSLVTASNITAARNTAGAGVLFTPSTANPPVSGLNKIAQASTNLDHAVVGNGGTVATAATYGMPVVDRLDIGNQLAGSYLNGSLARLTFWPTRLSNSTLQAITQ
jgi:hypothetical protein